MRYAAVLLATVCLFAQTKSPITHEKVWLMKRVGAPVASPDGKWFVVSVTEPAYDASQQITDLWLYATDPGKPGRRLTNTKAGESGVAWSPDGKQIAFATRREGDEAPQIYVLPLDGGEAWRLTSVATGASSPVWRPDGKALLYQVEVFDGAGSEADNARMAKARKERKYNAYAWDAYPIASWDRWVADRHPHPYVQELTPGAAPRDLLAGTKLIQQPGFAPKGTGDGGEDLDAAWSPDGGYVLFVATTNRNQVTVSQTSTHVFRVPVEGGEPEALTSGVDSYDSPQFSPDGKTLYLTHGRGGNDVLYAHDRIARMAWPPVAGAKPQTLAFSMDRPLNGYKISPDGKTLYLVLEENGREKICAMAVDGNGAVTPVSTGKSGIYNGLSVRGSVILSNWQSMIQPPEVVRIDPKSGEHTFLTNFTRDEAAKVDWQPPREFWTNSKTGKKIHSFLVLPPAFDATKKYPLLVFMHGGPHQAWKDQWFTRWNYHLLASPGYVVLMTNYTGSPGYGEKFAADINKDVLRGPATEINDAADEAIRQFPFIDASRQAAGGASYGGYLANWMQGNTTRYKVLFSHAGLSNNESMWGATDGGYYWELRYGGPVWEAKGQWQDQNPLRYAAKFRTPMLVTHGANDLRVPLGQSLEMFKLLQRQKVPSRFVMFPEENHWILRGENARYFFDEVFGWLQKYL